MARDSLEPALPREMYVDEAAWAAERETVLFGQWYCIGRIDDLGLRPAVAGAAVDVVGESVLVTSDEEAGCTRRTTSAGTAAPRSAPTVERRRPAVACDGVGAAVPVPLVDLRPRRPAAARRRTPTWTALDPATSR